MRDQLSVPVAVSCSESTDFEWTEHSELIDVSPFGARFTVKHPTEPGRLLRLGLKLPRQLRCFDHDEEIYWIWSVVRYANLVSSSDDSNLFEVGVAFTGKEKPQRAEDRPHVRYDVEAPASDGAFWQARLRDESSEQPEHERREPRQMAEIEVVVEVYDAQGRIIRTERTKSENISRRGMAVFTTLNLTEGRYIRVRSAEFPIAVIAAVRRLRTATDGRKRLHLEFVNQQWPLEQPETARIG